MTYNIAKTMQLSVNLAKKQGLSINIDPTESSEGEGASFILSSKDAGKAVLLGHVNLCDQSLVVAYKVDVLKWNWAMDEGFSRDEIIGDLGNKVFKEMSADPKKICAYFLGR